MEFQSPPRAGSIHGTTSSGTDNKATPEATRASADNNDTEKKVDEVAVVSDMNEDIDPSNEVQGLKLILIHLAICLCTFLVGLVSFHIILSMCTANTSNTEDNDRVGL